MIHIDPDMIHIDPDMIHIDPDMIHIDPDMIHIDLSYGTQQTWRSCFYFLFLLFRLYKQILVINSI